MVFKGTATTTAYSTAANIPSKIISFSLANTTGGAVTASVGIFLGSTITYLLYNQSINSANTYVYSGEAIIVPSEYSVFINVSGATDYYFSIE